jgi:hypothetical protein
MMTLAEELLFRYGHELQLVNRRFDPASPPSLLECIIASKRLKRVIDDLDEEVAFLDQRVDRLKLSNTLMLLLARSEDEREALRTARDTLQDAITCGDRPVCFRSEKSAGTEELGRALD